MTLVKPVMRGLLRTNIKRNLIGMTVTAAVSGILFKTFYVDRRKQLYADFYKTYDAEASLKRMNDSGYMQSSPK